MAGPQKVVSCDQEKLQALGGAVVLVDMDNTLVDWDNQFFSFMSRLHPDLPLQSSRTKWHIERNYPFEYHSNILSLTDQPEFWRSMQPMKGGIEAVMAMESAGFHVYIVSTPDSEHTARCAKEKIEWVDHYLGSEWRKKLVLVTDKTLVRGDILIDDKPGASKGQLDPTWVHVLFDHPYNAQEQSKPRLKEWADWLTVVYDAMLNRKAYHLEQQERLARDITSNHI